MNCCRRGTPLTAARLFAPLLLSALSGTSHAASDLVNLSINQLMNMEITTASRREQKLSETPAAVFVLTHEDIMHSGATTLPELLLTVPGVEGGAINAHSAAIGIRGLGGQWSNKLLVLIDGRSIYTRTFSGVYWDAYNIPFEDIQRIEVIRGPNAALWGANAVNGVINIITRNSAATQGTLLRGSVGTNASGDLLAQQGFQIGASGFARVYVSGEKHGNSAAHPSGTASDAWKGTHVGFRSDWNSASGTRLMLEGDIYNLSEHNNPLDPTQLPTNVVPVGVAVTPTSPVHGHSLQFNFTRAYGLTAEWSLQGSWSHSDRTEFLPLIEDSFDLDFQNHFKPWDGHNLVWGISSRFRRDQTHPTPLLSLQPTSTHDNDSSLFAQDEISLAGGRVLTTVGARLERDAQRKWVFQPSVRALWNVSDDQKLWGAVSRAARTPSRVDRSVTADLPISYDVPPYGVVPVTLKLRGNQNFKTEEMLSYELGYRLRPLPNLSFDLALYWNHYNRLRSIGLTNIVAGANGYTVGAQMENSMHGDIHGGELVANWAPTGDLRFRAFWSEAHPDFRASAISPTFAYADLYNNSTPRRQVGLHTDWDFASRWSLGVRLKYVSELYHTFNYALLKNGRVPAYVDCDFNLGWQLTPKFRLNLIGKNLLDNSRLEYSSEAGAKPTEVRRAGYVRATWSF